MTLQLAGQTDVGRRRRDNQDTFISTQLWSEQHALLVVIDGVGGYAGGEQAAAIAKESILRYMTAQTGDTLTMLREAVVYANNQIDEARRQDAQLAQMCCVLTAAVASTQTQKVVFAHVGDTRMYRFRAGASFQLEKITHDHSLVGVREDANQLTEAQAMSHPRRNEVFRTVGSAMHRVDDPEFLESGETDFLPGDGLLLCSDGLTDMLPRAQIIEVLSQSLTLEEQATELIRRANEQGGHDNITVVLAQNKDVSTAGNRVTAATAIPRPTDQTEHARPVASAPVVEEKRAKRSNGGLILGVLLLIALVAGGLYWYQFYLSRNSWTPADTLATTESSSPTPALDTRQSLLMDSLLQLAYRGADHQLIWPMDTLRLTQPLVLTDSLQAVMGASPQKPVVILTSDTTGSQPAFRIAGVKNARLENLVIQGYKTAIETDTDGPLQLRNVVFSGVESSVRAAIRQDTCRNATLQISIQEQPVLNPNRQANANR